MSRTDEQHVILAASERLDELVVRFRQHVKELDVDEHNKFALRVDQAMLEGVALYLRTQKTTIAETQP